MPTIVEEVEIDLEEHVDVYKVQDTNGNESSFTWDWDADNDIIVTLYDCYIVSKEEYNKLQTINLLNEE